MNMTKLYCRSIYDELNDLRVYLDLLFQQMEEPREIALLPSAGEQPKLLPSMKGELIVKVTEYGNEVIVTVDVIEGIAKKDISIDLINPQLLEISGKCKKEKKEDIDGYYMTESRSGSMTHVIPLPKPVTEEKSMALFKNSVLEIHLRKETRKPGTKIIIE